MRIFVRYILGPILGIIVARASIFAIHKIGYQPDVWLGELLAAMYLDIPRGDLVWIISAIIGLSLYVVELKFKPIEKLVNLFNYKKLWFERDQLELYVIACLSSNRRPRLPVSKEPQLSRHRLLKDAVSDGHLKPVKLEDGAEASVWTKIRFDDFMKFAEERGHEDFLGLSKEWGKYHQREAKSEDCEEYMPLSEAAQAAYEELRACGNSAHVTMAERDSTATPEKILQYFSIAISLEVDVFGKHQPSTRLEKIDRDEYKKGMFCDSGNTFKYYGQDKAKYVDIAIKKIDLEPAIEELKTVKQLG